MASIRGWSMYQLYVESDFLHREMGVTIYVEQPLGYVKKGEEKKGYRLHKALYGLK